MFAQYKKETFKWYFTEAVCYVIFTVHAHMNDSFPKVYQEKYGTVFSNLLQDMYICMTYLLQNVQAFPSVLYHLAIVAFVANIVLCR